jgi:hypothetical protein
VDDQLCSIFEPHVPGPDERLKAVAYFKQHGLNCGLFLMPVIPFITDNSELMEQVFKKGKAAGIDFIIFGGLTLKSGKQKAHFMNVIKDRFPEHYSSYDSIYLENRWGQASGKYYKHVHDLFFVLAKKYGMPVRVPRTFFSDILDENDRVIVILEHMDYLLKLRGEASPFGYAAYSISKLREPLSEYKTEWQKLSGIGTSTAGIIEEIIESGTSVYYQKLMAL